MQFTQYSHYHHQKSNFNYHILTTTVSSPSLATSACFCHQVFSNWDVQLFCMYAHAQFWKNWQKIHWRFQYFIGNDYSVCLLNVQQARLSFIIKLIWCYLHVLHHYHQFYQNDVAISVDNATYTVCLFLDTRAHTKHRKVIWSNLLLNWHYILCDGTKHSSNASHLSSHKCISEEDTSLKLIKLAMDECSKPFLNNLKRGEREDAFISSLSSSFGCRKVYCSFWFNPH